MTDTKNDTDWLGQILWQALASAVTASINSDQVDTTDKTEAIFNEARAAIQSRHNQEVVMELKRVQMRLMSTGVGENRLSQFIADRIKFYRGKG